MVCWKLFLQISNYTAGNPVHGGDLHSCGCVRQWGGSLFLQQEKVVNSDIFYMKFKTQFHIVVSTRDFVTLHRSLWGKRFCCTGRLQFLSYSVALVDQIFRFIGILPLKNEDILTYFFWLVFGCHQWLNRGFSPTFIKTSIQLSLFRVFFNL